LALTELNNDRSTDKERIQLSKMNNNTRIIIDSKPRCNLAYTTNKRRNGRHTASEGGLRQ